MAARTTIGLDIGTSGVRAAELSFDRTGLMTLEKFGQVSVEPGAVRDGEVVDQRAVADALRRLWDGTKFSHKNVALGVANQRVIVRQVELPWMPAADLRKALPYQVQDLIPMPVEEAVLDFHPVEVSEGPSGPVQRGLLVAAARETLMANIRCVEAAGLLPTAVDLTPFAVLRALSQSARFEPRTEALIDVGAAVTNIVVHTAGVPTFVRILLRGGQAVTDILGERLGMPQVEAEALKQTIGTQDVLDRTAYLAVEGVVGDFVEEIRGSLDYYGASHPGAPIERIVVSGGGSQLGGLISSLSRTLMVPVTEGDPMSTMRMGRTGLDDAQLSMLRPLVAVPVGLAMGASR